MACNVSDWAQCDNLVDTAYAEFGRMDILTNNAGMSPLYPSLDQVGESLWDKVIGLNQGAVPAGGPRRNADGGH